MLWVTRQSRDGRFNVEPILGFIETPSHTVALDDGHSFIQHEVDAETLAGVLKQGRSVNQPDAAAIDLLIEAIQAKRYHILNSKNPSNPTLVVKG